MNLDSLTVEVLARELDARHRQRHIRRALADTAALTWQVEGPEAALCEVRLAFGPPGGLRLGEPTRLAPAQGRERYLEGARIEAIEAVPCDRLLRWRLSRPDAAGLRTHGTLHVHLIPPRYLAMLVSDSHGRLLGSWAATDDRHALSVGADYAEPSPPSGVVDPHDVDRNAFRAAWTAWEGSCVDGLRRLVRGADRHLATSICLHAGRAPEEEAQSSDPEALASAIEAVWQAARGAWAWNRGQRRVSVVSPGGPEGAEAFESVWQALTQPLGEADAAGGRSDPRIRLRRGLKVLQRREAGLQADLEEAAGADDLERAGHSLMAAAHLVPTGGQARVPDAHDATGAGTIAVELRPGETATDHAARLLRRAAKLRRRADALPVRLYHVRERIYDTENLLQALEAGEEITEERMERWERRVELRPSPARDADGGGDGQRGDDRQGARPRRYRTSSGWSVWAGRNNKENDIVTHRLAAQNDVWFHAHGYAGSHVILRREGRKDEPDNRTLEEAAAVAAYWSKGRTANKVPVVYTLAKFVSKPRGGPPGLAVMKREKTLMVRPDLLPEEESA
jgi:predicted ribosome quality control (RQC) complex YloA/Tae2 family protein